MTNDSDSGAGSLRQAISDLCDGGIITFDGDYYMIRLASTLTIDGNLTIDGTGQSIILSGDSDGDGTNDVRVLEVSSSGNLTIQQLKIADGTNTDTAGGGGIYNQGQLQVHDSYFADNSATATGFGGGAIQNNGAMTVTTSLFTTNDSDRGGAIFNKGSTTALLENNTFYANSATNGGGAIHNRGVMTMTNNTVVANDAPNGGGIQTWNGTDYLANNLIAENTGSVDLNSSGVVFSVNNFIGDGSSIDALSGDALLGSLDDYGGTQQTIALLLGSPAIDAGSDTYCPTTDQRGQGRVGTCDIGAFESQGFTLTIAAGHQQTTTVGSVFALPVAVVVAANNSFEPVPDGVLSFSAPSTGASLANPVFTAMVNANYYVEEFVYANMQVGSYQLTASAAGADSVVFDLTNSAAPTATPTNTPVPTATSSAPSTPTATSTPEPTATAVTPTSTATATNTPEPTTTPVVPTSTATPVPPTATATNTAEPTATNTPEPTATAVEPTSTSTSVPPTATPVAPTSTPTPVEPTAIATNTPEPTATDAVDPTSTPTATAVDPTNTAEPTATPVDPTSTATPIPSTATATATTEPTATVVDPTSTATSVPPTATNPAEPTATPVNPTSTATNTPEPTATNTLVPTAEPTNTPDAQVDVQPEESVTLPVTLPSGGQLHLQVPSGAVDTPTTLTIEVLEAPTDVPASFQFAGQIFAIDAYQAGSQVDGFTFTQPITLVITYTDADVAGLDEATLTLLYLDPDTGSWLTDGITVIERSPAENRIVLLLSHLTDFALFSVDNQPTETAEMIYLPIVSARWKVQLHSVSTPHMICSEAGCWS
ncbi:MAG: choice-of-anchor Q domain-containing protein [Caldilineaceae bacterium]